MMGSGTGMGWGWMFGALIVAGAVLLVVLAARAIGGGVSSRPSASGPTAGSTSGPGRGREVLDERYARGDLTTEEYQERLRVLGDNQ
ncbi:MAG: SHOCT domain-containing protein [Nocardioides sp.]